MISCKLYGGLGNNLFQIAATIGFAFRHGEKYCVPTKIINPHLENQKVFYSKYLNYCEEGIATATVYKEPNFHYNEIPAPHSKYTLLDGYFQSELYWSDFKDEVLKILDIPYEFKDGYCAILVRRGDYLNLPAHHPVISSIYLQEAQMKMMRNGIGKFIVFSDDLDFCRNSMPQFEDADYIFSEGKTDIEDLSLASSCSCQIGSNSAYSFWAYYLNKNKNKIGIFPKKERWFGKMLPHNVENLYMKEWCLV